ncbi:hypothetical protein [uncultured Nocardioides sp.]|uniref:hypothetical protein n=1 Tax=uncultured Nocardioides sp. TaxID=198441 RepID=UPI000C4CE85C|nr:hypothetical protein [Nocardioides sp.]
MVGTDRGARPDFEAYAAARRPDLVRLGVLLGHPAGHAAVLADRALVRAQRSWRRRREEHDPDAGLRDLLLEERRAAVAAGEAWWRSPWAEEQASLPASLRADLDRLPVDARARLAWAALGRSDVDLLDATDPGLLASVTTAVPGLPVAPPTGAVPPRRRGPVLRVAALVAAVVMVGGLVTVLQPDPPTSDPSTTEPALGPVAITALDSSEPVSWYADGRIRIKEVGQAEVSGVVALADVFGYVVYVHEGGDVVRLGPDGERVLLGRADPGAGLVAAEPAQQVAWVAEDGRTLEVANVLEVEVVARLETVLPGDEDALEDASAELPRLVRFAAPELVFVDAAGEHQWHTRTGSVSTVVSDPDQGDLVDVVGVTQLRQVGRESIQVRQLLGTPVVRLGEGGEISPLQRFVLTRSGEGGTGVRVFAVGSGEEVDSGVTRNDVVLDARFVSPARITFLLADRAAVPGASEAGRSSATGPLEIRTCEVRAAGCVIHWEGGGLADSGAVLAR